jgi:hypothetical protein
MRIGEVRTIVQVGHWLEDRGFIVSEHPSFGKVHRVHAPGSLHYKGKAMDVNYNVHAANMRREWDSEREALSWLYDHLLESSERFSWPLDELFFRRRGFLKETPNDNHPVDGHEEHLHVGFFNKTWQR